ncbi:MAG: hypothetical protein AB1489_03205 [Acidobacteriota bacterium]
MKTCLYQKISSLLLVAVLIAASAISALALDPKGRPKGMGPNAPGGYFIWQDERGWHLRTTSGNEKHHFEAEITSEGGTISAAKQYRDEPASWLKQQGSKITIDLTTEKNIDGIDFQSSGGSLTFKLRIDGQEDPERIQIGANSDRPSGIPFTIPVR